MTARSVCPLLRTELGTCGPVASGTRPGFSRIVPPLPLSALPCAAPQRPPLSRAAPQATAMYLIRYAYKGSASLQLDAHTHQQEQDEIERLEGRA